MFRAPILRQTSFVHKQQPIQSVLFGSHLRTLSITASRPYRREPHEPTGPNEPPSHTNSSRSKSPLKVWPFVAIFAAGTFMFKKIVDQRKGTFQANGPVAGHSPSRP